MSELSVNHLLGIKYLKLKPSYNKKKIFLLNIVVSFRKALDTLNKHRKTLITKKLIRITKLKNCKKLKYDLELLQNTFATSFEQVAHRVTCLQDPKLPGIPFHMLRVDMAGNISKRFSLSGIDIPSFGDC